jgi:hypothetical protein
MRFACLINKVIDTHSEYVILIAFPLQQLICERPSVLRYSTLPVLLYLYRDDAPVVMLATCWNKHGANTEICSPDYEEKGTF